MTRRQTPADRRARFKNGCCPIHGLGMSQVAGWEERIGGRFDGDNVTIVGCARRDCAVRAYALGPNGPYELLPEFEYLLADGAV